MIKDNVIALKKPESFIVDQITDILRQGARKLLAQALEAEIDHFMSQYAGLKDDRGRQRLVRNGFMPERAIQSGVGSVSVQAPRVRDRHPHAPERIRFSSAILPPYLRRTKSIGELIPWLYLKGISTSDFSEALAALLGKDAPGLSSATISRLKSVWLQDYAEWKKRDLSHKQ